MNKLRREKGITLVALIITIVVLLILAIVSIGAVKDSKIIAYAQDASSKYTIGNETEEIGIAVSSYQLQKTITGDTETLFYDTVKEELKNVAEVTPNSDKTILTVVFRKTGNEYKVTKEGKIEGPIPPETKGIQISPKSLSIAPGETAQLTATLNGIEGTVTFESADTNIATVDQTSGLVTGISAGKTTITATCGENQATCEVTVEEKKEKPSRTYRLEGGDFYFKLTKEHTYESGASGAVYGSGKFEYVDEVTPEIIRIINEEQDSSAKVSENVSDYSRAILLNGLYMLLSSDEKILYYAGYPLILDESIVDPDAEWLTYGTQDNYILVGTNKAYVVRNGAIGDLIIDVEDKTVKEYFSGTSLSSTTISDARLESSYKILTYDYVIAELSRSILAVISEDRYNLYILNHGSSSEGTKFDISLTYSLNNGIDYTSALKEIQ